MIRRSILSLASILVVALFFDPTSGFGISNNYPTPTLTTTTTTRAIDSPLFAVTSSIDHVRTSVRPSKSTRFPLQRHGTSSALSMAVSEGQEADDDSNADAPKEKKEMSGFLAAMVMGPPLVAKFIIVLLVKFLNDLVVYPLLYLYRTIRLLKNKVLSICSKNDDESDKTPTPVQ
uniref:Uncharacterized protein n=1 Tax=Attheya septentrionalis TaxID=420275 RepID=A0A7S2XLE9_9STRA|mmetsp:Transcript_1818/g.3232  ORF Transcript_1818/g.3232 Transcript_1818/m.3232 type:complete len:175 (+) Transcript_1818:244-768(+)